MPPDGNAAQNQIIMDRIADAAAREAVKQFIDVHPELGRPKAEIPSPLKWAGGIVASLFTLAVGAMAVWLVGSVSSMQVTLAVIDERMKSQDTAKETRFVSMEARLAELEGASRASAKR